MSPLLLLAACAGRYELGEVSQSLDQDEPVAPTIVGQVIIDELADLDAPLSRESEGSVGDVDGDGYDDWFANDPREAPGDADLQLVYGGPRLAGDMYAAERLGPAITYESWLALGWYPHAAGDLDGDGFADVLINAVGMSNYVPPEETSRPSSFLEHWGEQRAYVLYGGPRAASTTRLSLGEVAVPFAPIEAVRAGIGDELALDTDPEATGWSVAQRTNLASLGDIDSDGFGDFAYTYSVARNDLEQRGNTVFETGELRTSAITYIFYGGGRRPSAEDPIASANVVLPDVTALASLGDIDGDGRPEVVATKSGVLYLLPDSPARMGGSLAVDAVGAPLLTAESREADGRQETRELIAIGDIDGDGYDDLMLRYLTNIVLDGDAAHEATHLFYGSASRLDQPLRELDADATFPRAGIRTVKPLGDWNGDGLPDLLASKYNVGDNGEATQPQRDSAVIIAGRPDRYSGVSSAALPDAPAAGFGIGSSMNVRPLGDIDGDGSIDLEVSVRGEGTFIEYGASSSVIY